MLEKREEKLRREIAELRMAIETLRKAQEALPSDPLQNQMPVGPAPKKTTSVSQELREFIPFYLNERSQERFLKAALLDAVTQKGIGASAKSLDALLSKTVTELVKNGIIIKDIDNNNSYYTSTSRQLNGTLTQDKA